MIRFSIFSVFVFFCSGCASTGVYHKAGPALITNHRSHASLGVDRGKPVRKGKACVNNIFGIVATGDGGIEAAKRNGGIRKAYYVDEEVLNVLFLYGKYCTVVYGE